jgi:alpha-beta hydrolase superfamily lysophospholipase
MRTAVLLERHLRPAPPAPAGRGRARWIAACLTIVALLVAACSGADGGATPQGTTTTAAAPQPLEQPSRRCGDPATKATLVRFQAADGTSLDGVLVGSGPAGVVLAHEYPADLCGFWPFAEYLANRGLRAFAIDLRCFGRSACPEGDARGRVVDDLDAAAAELRRRGATRVALVGASMGGAAVLIAGTRVQPPVAAVVSLSAETDPTSLVGGIPLDAGAAVKRLAVPTMLVVATNDRYVSVTETRAMYRAASTGDKRLEVLSGSFDGLHGWELLTNPANGASTSVAAKVAAFLTTHTRG